jgi:hypothetical protein
VTATPTFAIPSLPPKTVVANPTAIVVTPVPARSPAVANPTSNLTPGGNNVQSLAKQAVANDMQRNYGVSVANQEMVSISETEWSDSSLGCPQPGMTYLQVITPGYLIVMKDKPQNVQYEYHTDMRGRAVMCHKTS